MKTMSCLIGVHRRSSAAKIAFLGAHSTPAVAIGLAFLVSLSAVSAQGTADAFAARISGASISSTVTLATPGGNGVPGQALTIPFTLSLAGATAPSSFQIDLSFDPTKLTFVSASAGTPLTNAGMGLSSTVVPSGVRLSTTGASPNAISSGVVAYATFILASPFGATGTPVTLANCMSGGALGTPLSTGCIAGTVTALTCDVNGDGTVGVVDVQTMINEALGTLPGVNDLNQDGLVNIVDIQMVIDAALGMGCTLTAG
jgi:hypothetical protein